MKGLQVDDGRNRNRDPLLSGPKSALALLTVRPFHRCTVVAVLIQRANIGLIMKNSIHGIEIPFPTTTWRQNSLQCELLCDLTNRPALLHIEIKDSANHHRFVLIDLHMCRHTVTTWNAQITKRGSPVDHFTTPSSVELAAPIPFDNLRPFELSYGSGDLVRKLRERIVGRTALQENCLHSESFHLLQNEGLQHKLPRQSIGTMGQQHVESSALRQVAHPIQGGTIQPGPAVALIGELLDDLHPLVSRIV